LGPLPKSELVEEEACVLNDTEPVKEEEEVSVIDVSRSSKEEEEVSAIDVSGSVKEVEVSVVDVPGSGEEEEDDEVDPLMPKMEVATIEDCLEIKMIVEENSEVVYQEEEEEKEKEGDLEEEEEDDPEEGTEEDIEDYKEDNEDEQEACEKVAWNKTKILSAYKAALKNKLGQFKRIYYTSSQFKYHKYDFVVKRKVLLLWHKWAQRNPGKEYEFWVGWGKKFERKASQNPENMWSSR
jgi:hypothetical protein